MTELHSCAVWTDLLVYLPKKIKQTKQSKTWDKFISSLFFTWNPFKNILFDNNFIDQFSTLTTSYMALHNRIVHTFKLFVFTHAWKHFIHFIPVEGRNHTCLGNCKIGRTYSMCLLYFDTHGTNVIHGIYIIMYKMLF